MYLQKFFIRINPTNSFFSKVEKTPPVMANGMRLCVFCNGQVRPQMCGGNKHRWRCVDKKCRKWYYLKFLFIKKYLKRKKSKYLIFYY